MQPLACTEHTMPLETAKVMNEAAVAESRLQLYPFTEDAYPTQSRFHGKRRVLLVGTGKLARELYRALLSKRLGLMEIVGTLVEGNKRTAGNPDIPKIIGTHEDLAQLVAEQRVNTIAVCFEDARSALPVEQLLELKLMGIDVLDGHQLFEEVSGRCPVDSLRR